MRRYACATFAGGAAVTVIGLCTSCSIIVFRMIINFKSYLSLPTRIGIEYTRDLCSTYRSEICYAKLV